MSNADKGAVGLIPALELASLTICGIIVFKGKVLPAEECDR